MQAVYVPADDYSDPAPVAVFTHLDGTIALERSIAARERAAKMMQEGVPPELNREAALSLRRAELAMRINQKMRQRGTPVMRILEQEE
jgi:hypothetical protein